MTLQPRNRRSEIVEIVTAENFVVTLTQAGVCAVFRKCMFRNSMDPRWARTARATPHTKQIPSPLGTLTHVCFMNSIPDEVIRSLFYNKVKIYKIF